MTKNEKVFFMKHCKYEEEAKKVIIELNEIIEKKENEIRNLIESYNNLVNIVNKSLSKDFQFEKYPTDR